MSAIKAAPSAASACGAASTQVYSMVTGRTNDFFSVKTSGESCSIQGGNVFGN